MKSFTDTHDAYHYGNSIRHNVLIIFDLRNQRDALKFIFNKLSENHDHLPEIYRNNLMSDFAAWRHYLLQQIADVSIRLQLVNEALEAAEYHNGLIGGQEGNQEGGISR